MKKTYVKPAAVSVAFAVNENIALSGFLANTEGGVVKYVNHSGGNCNKYLSTTGIATGLKEGCVDYEHMMNNLMNQKDEKFGTDFNELMSILDELKKNKQDFACVVPGE